MVGTVISAEGSGMASITSIVGCGLQLTRMPFSIANVVHKSEKIAVVGTVDTGFTVSIFVISGVFGGVVVDFFFLVCSRMLSELWSVKWSIFDSVDSPWLQPISIKAMNNVMFLRYIFIYKESRLKASHAPMTYKHDVVKANGESVNKKKIKLEMNRN